MNAAAENTATAPAVPAGTQLSVQGMTCQNCVRHVRDAISSVPGVSTASVNLDQHSASVRWADGTKPNVDAIARAVNEAGYQAKEVESQRSEYSCRRVRPATHCSIRIAGSA